VVLTPSLFPCCIGLRLKRGFGELVWELLTLGSRAPFLLARTYRGSGDRERLGAGSRPPDHLERHTLLGASIAGINPLRMAF
jgi:hypothetical protein